MRKPDRHDIFDVFVVGGGINGCGIARDAAGRGLKVGLAEMNDLGSATSSSSTKLFHGGLRYLEFFEFRLVREALKEREVLLKNMPHISWPMRFILPLDKNMRFPQGTRAARLLNTIMPWLNGRRPAWMIRLALFLYDNLGGREILPGTTKLQLSKTHEGEPLKARFTAAYEYSDCWVQDARLVVLNAQDAAKKGAEIMVRTAVESARREDGCWIINLNDGVSQFEVRSKSLVNAGGPWVADILTGKLGLNSREAVRLVRGSHIVTRKLFDHPKSYFFQGSDGRIIFAIPYEHDFTLIGTTEADHDNLNDQPVCSDEERDYLLNFASQYFEQNLSAMWGAVFNHPRYGSA